MSVIQAIQRGIDLGAMLFHSGYRDDDHQLAWLWCLAALAPDGIAVECGVYKGGSLVVWADARKGRGPIVAVDNWQGYGPELREAFQANVDGIEVELLEMASWEAAGLLGEVAFCFIDAGHDEDRFPHDLRAWPDRIKPGGILAFHDYGTFPVDIGNPNVVVKEYVDEWQAKAQWVPLGRIGSLIAFRRPTE